jgi:RNA polymerase sigma-70 factor (ECF subfamily)
LFEAKAERNQELDLAQAETGNVTFLAFYDRYFSRVYTYFRYRFDDPAVCDDLVSQTFLQAWDNFAQVSQERGPFVAWLFGIARNLANRNLQKKRRLTFLPIDLLSFLAAGDPSPEEEVISQDEQKQVLAALPSLTSQQRDLLALKFSARLTNRQIASLTGMSEQNVAVTVHRAVRKLREKIEGKEEEYAR